MYTPQLLQLLNSPLPLCTRPFPYVPLCLEPDLGTLCTLTSLFAADAHTRDWVHYSFLKQKKVTSYSTEPKGWPVTMPELVVRPLCTSPLLVPSLLLNGSRTKLSMDRGSDERPCVEGAKR